MSKFTDLVESTINQPDDRDNLEIIKGYCSEATPSQGYLPGVLKKLFTLAGEDIPDSVNKAADIDHVPMDASEIKRLITTAQHRLDRN